MVSNICGCEILALCEFHTHKSSLPLEIPINSIFIRFQYIKNSHTNLFSINGCQSK